MLAVGVLSLSAQTALAQPAPVQTESAGQTALPAADSFPVVLARFIQVPTVDSGEILAARIKETGLTAFVAAASGAVRSKLDSALPTILASRLEPFPYRLDATNAQKRLIPTLSAETRGSLFAEPASLVSAANAGPGTANAGAAATDSAAANAPGSAGWIIVGFYAATSETVHFWLFGFPGGATAPGYSFTGATGIAGIENYPDSLLAGVCSWIAGEPLRVLDIDTGPLTEAPEISIAKEDQSVAYARGLRLFVRGEGELSSAIEVKEKGYLSASLSVGFGDSADQAAGQTSPPTRYRREAVRLDPDGTASKPADSFNPSSLTWAGEKPYKNSLSKFRRSFGYSAVSLPVSLLCTGWFVQCYEAASRSGTNSVWFYVSGGAAVVTLGTAIAFLVDAGINLAASLRNSE